MGGSFHRDDAAESAGQPAGDGAALPPMFGIESPAAGNGLEVEISDVDIPDDAQRDDDGHHIGSDDLDADVEVVLPEESAASPEPEPEIARPVDPFIGRYFGGYQLVEPIGRGGMGMVYRGVQVSLQRSVAVKLLNKALVDNEEFIIRFQREARAMATIHHQNIVSVIDFGETDGVWYMVAEFVEGTNLARLIRDKLMVPPDELVPIIVHCLSGLAHVAKSQVIHRDIKPDNILIDGDGVAKIADFGLAKDMSKEETDLTAAGSAMGTPAYMSPEQCMGHSLDGRSDIYSLGVTIYYALTGEKPFTGRSSFDIMTKQREYNPPMVHEINPRVPKEISHLVARMMEKAPSKRHIDSSECREEWLQVGQELGYLGSVTRSGEYLFPSEAGVQAQVAYPQEDDSAPAGALDMSAVTRGGGHKAGHGAGPIDEFEMPEAPPVAPPGEAAHVDEGTGRRGVSTNRSASDGTGRRKSGTERRGGSVGSAQGIISCEKCGAINRPSRKSCEKCGFSFVDEESGSNMPDQTEADRLFRVGKYRDAAALYGRLAEKETDRRRRSVLRTKEREARTRLEERQLEDAQATVEDLASRGKYRDAEEVLVKVRNSANATSSIIETLDRDLNRLRRQRRGDKRRSVLLVLIAFMAILAIAAWVVRDRLVEWVPALRGLLPPADAVSEAPVAPGAAAGESEAAERDEARPTDTDEGADGGQP
ncbi:MAG: protein kinase [Planctomycetota bacterium]|nr:protein kinase [Planctomycetota bacterium]